MILLLINPHDREQVNMFLHKKINLIHHKIEKVQTEEQVTLNQLVKRLLIIKMLILNLQLQEQKH
ncbi:MAG: hypothetical protein OHM56_06055 [Spiroplasma phoeniceum]|nr:MAG: hypothetical protein OHM57_05465 [Spiroplasma phoeniceum]UZQ33477.1 MAG: hypothetical protein OHM56_06055 [Spiroplasma phoeniceum]